MTKSDTGSELVFVCGPLRQGGSHASLMDVRAELVGRATVEGCLHAIGWFPAFSPEKGAGKVTGELYRVTPALLSELDEFERKASSEVDGAECRRVRVEARMLTLSGEARLEAWAWEWRGPVESGQRILWGDWLERTPPRGFPWFTFIGAACTITLPVGAVGSVLFERSKGPLSDFVATALAFGSLLAPFAALGAIWFGMRAREGKGPLGCITIFAMAGAIISGLAVFKWLEHVLR